MHNLDLWLNILEPLELELTLGGCHAVENALSLLEFVCHNLCLCVLYVKFVVNGAELLFVLKDILILALHLVRSFFAVLVKDDSFHGCLGSVGPSISEAHLWQAISS